jgi:hypothetical protein
VLQKDTVRRHQGVAKRFSLSRLTKSSLVYEPKCGGGDCGVSLSASFSSANEYSCARGAQINVEDQTIYLAYGRHEGPSN